MIEIIYDVATLEDSCYIEILPDKYKDECWNTSSIYFTEENFCYIMPTFRKCYKKFDYFSFNEIEVDTWKLIMKELEKVKNYLINNPIPDTLKDVIGFPFTNSEKDFMEYYDTNLKQLILMIDDFQVWIEARKTSTNYITVLGM